MKCVLDFFNILFWVFIGVVCFFFIAVDFFNQINMLYGTITEFCTPEECPVMSAGPMCVDSCSSLCTLYCLAR